MFAVYFDDDSYIFNGETLYFNKEENILPFIKENLNKYSYLIKKEMGYSSVEEYLKEMGDFCPWYIKEIVTED